MRIGIVGLGIGGATAAAVLTQRGCDVTVFEQASEIREVGAGVATWPNTIRIYRRHGFGEALAEIGCVAHAQTPVYDRDGRVLHHMVRETYDDTPSYHFHRAELQQAIASFIPRDRIRLGRRCVEAEDLGSTVRLTFADGGTEDFDLVIGADGIHSVTHGAVLPPSPPKFSNLVAYRGLAPNTPEIGAVRAGLWTDCIQYFVAYPVSSGRLINFVGVVPTPSGAEESWFKAGRLEDLAAEFADWDPVIGRIIAAAPETFLWGLYYREPAPRMVQNRIALLGDAAHPMLIHAGQGVGQAMEDAFALGVFLDGCRTEDVPQRLRLYEQLRLPRATAVQEGSRRNAEFMHEAFPLPPGQPRPQRTTPTDWIVNYDVEAEAEKMLAGEQISA